MFSHREESPHSYDVWGLDLEYDEAQVPDPHKYKKVSAENFDFNLQFDAILASDVIEHLSNPGLFLKARARNLKPTGRLIITTDNCYSLFDMASCCMRSL